MHIKVCSAVLDPRCSDVIPRLDTTIKLTVFKWNEHQSQCLKFARPLEGDPVLSRARYCILHGWPAENCIPDELKIENGANGARLPCLPSKSL